VCLAGGADLFCREIEEGLGFDHRDLVGVCGKGVDVQLIVSCFEVDIAEGLEPADF